MVMIITSFKVYKRLTKNYCLFIFANTKIIERSNKQKREKKSNDVDFTYIRGVENLRKEDKLNYRR